jgi:hypothetical protein
MIKNQIQDPARWRLEATGDMGSTILHVICDRWYKRRHAPLLDALMERFPDMYLAEDSLGRTVLERNKSDGITYTFIGFFTAVHDKQAVELIRRKTGLLALLLGTFQDTNLWGRILKRIPFDRFLDRDKSGITFLHHHSVRSSSICAR